MLKGNASIAASDVGSGVSVAILGGRFRGELPFIKQIAIRNGGIAELVCALEKRGWAIEGESDNGDHC